MIMTTLNIILIAIAITIIPFYNLFSYTFCKNYKIVGKTKPEQIKKFWYFYKRHWFLGWVSQYDTSKKANLSCYYNYNYEFETRQDAMQEMNKLKAKRYTKKNTCTFSTEKF